MSAIEIKSFFVKALESFFPLLIKAGAVFSAFMLSYMVAINTGAAGAGVFYFCFTVYVLIAAVARFGTDQSIIKYIARYKSKRQINNALFGLTFFISLLSLILVILLQLFIHIFEFDAVYIEELKMSSLTIIFFSLNFVFSNFLQAVGKPKLYVFFVSMLSPFLTCLIAFLNKASTAMDFLFINMFSSFLTMLFCFYFLSKELNLKTASLSIFNNETMVIISNSLPFLLISMLTLFNQWYPTIFITFFANIEDAGLFSIAHRVALVFTSLSVVIGAIYAPKIMRESDDYSSLKKVIKQSLLFLFFVGGFGVAFLLFFSEYIFSFFGHAFLKASSFFYLLVIAQFIMLFIVLLGWVLLALDLQKALTRIVFIVCLSNVVIFYFFFDYLKLDTIYSVCFSILFSALVYLFMQILVIFKKLK